MEDATDRHTNNPTPYLNSSLTMYQPASQSRSKVKEQAFLQALDRVLVRKSFRCVSVDEIAQEAGLTKGAFLKRFGTKRQALYVLFEQYCDKTTAEMNRIVGDLPNALDLHDVLLDMSQTLERLISADYSANRAMHEDFQEYLDEHPLTRRIFLECVEMMRHTQQRFIKAGTCTDTGAFSAAQLLITINFNYVLNAMPGLPRSSAERHRMIAQMLHLVIHH